MPDAYDFWAERIAADEAAAITRFWDRFISIAPDLDRAFIGEAGDIDPAQATIDAVGVLHDMGIFWEHGPSEEGHHLTLSPELNHEARALARAVVAAAPELDRWTFSDFRPPVELDDSTVALISGRAQVDFSLTGARPEASDHQRIDFVGLGRDDTATLGMLAGLTFSVLFGEAIERDWLGEVCGERTGLMSSLLGQTTDPMTWLPDFVDSTEEVLQDLLEGRPEVPRGGVSSRDAKHVLFKIEPYGSASDLGADLFSYTTANEDLAAAILSNARLSAERFTRFDESFCGIAIARTAEHSFDDVEDRGNLAEKIHADLSSHRIGGLTGEGHGLGHVYIDLAVTEIPAAIAMVETVLGRNQITAPAWFRFHEAGLEERHIPLTPAATKH